MDYPVLEILSELKQKLADNRIVILQAPPGAGKSTVLPLHLTECPWLKGEKIIMLEPRRLAARSVAMRLASLRNEEAGKSVGYRVRFESRISDQTKIEVVTEGILTRMIQHDNALEGVGLVIFDEFHERSLQADLALALCLQVQQVLRDDLRILIMSATLDGEKLSSLLNAPVVTSLGRQFPVTTKYIVPEANTPIPVKMAKAIRKAFYDHPGDILAFFPGAGEIQRTADLLEQENLPVSLHPLFGDLSFQKQQQAITPHPQGLRKIVLATSIAETSLTIEGITVVVDSGYSRVPRFDPRSGLTRLETIPVTKDSADQRAGRAGRLGPGICYRLWSEGSHANLLANRTPEVLEADLAPLVLEISQWGVKDIASLSWVTMPPVGAISQAKELLHDLQALEDGSITERGKRMLKFPTHPRIAHMLLEAQEETSKVFKTASLAADLAALLEERDPLPKESGADLSLRIEVLRRWRSGERVSVDRNSLERIDKLAASWRSLLKAQVDNAAVSDKEVGKLIMAAYPERIARQVDKHSERYKLVNGRMVKLPPHDPLTREPWLAIAQLDGGGGEGKIFQAAPLSEDDLVAKAVEQTRIDWDEERGMVVGYQEKRVGSLLLRAKAIHVLPTEEKVQVLCKVIKDQGLRILDWEETLKPWQARLMSLKAWRKDEDWPDVSDEHLLNTAEEWLAPFLTNVSKRTELQRLNAAEIMSTILPYGLNGKIDTLAPKHLQVPSGSFIQVNYFQDGQSPFMEVRLQEVFGLGDTPTVNDGHTKIILHLLSPGYKPVQVTQDLKSFWTNTYAEVRKELRSRYPKHSWPDDPWTAQAVRGAKRRNS